MLKRVLDTPMLVTKTEIIFVEENVNDVGDFALKKSPTMILPLRSKN